VNKIAAINPYPGSTASAVELIRLADTYLDAATQLMNSACKKRPLSYAPARLCAIHAIEIYLNAVMRIHGVPAVEIRARMHNLANPEFTALLKLRKKTALHLAEMTARREYLISRYAPDMTAQHTELNRLQATLNEVSTKTRKLFQSTPISQS